MQGTRAVHLETAPAALETAPAPLEMRPRVGLSLFWRTFLFLSLLLIGCIVAWLQTFRALEFEPRAVQSAKQLASLVNLSRAALKYSDSITRVWVQNLTIAKLTVVKWNWENGRFFQMLSLFMLGMLAARKGLFALTPDNRRLWLKTLIVAVVLFAPLYWLKIGLPTLMASEAMRRPLLTAVTSWSNLAFMFVLVSAFILLFHSVSPSRVLRVFAPIGRMSLTSYVIQSIIGTALYYGFGLGLYKSTGASLCLLIGSVLALLQLGFSVWWLRHHRQGPLEALWHKATWLGARSS